MTEEKTVPLNLLFNYPVRWDTYKILRDFVQNFYDAKPREQWWQNFSYKFEEDVGILTLEMKECGFSYEWLQHIGASSKTGKKDSAGYYGEGFKIASLCALRDMGWEVYMSSRDWRIQVMGMPFRIDESEQTELVYRITPQSEKSKSVLVLKGLSQADFSVFKDVLLSFFYSENPLLGRKIFENDEAAVYARSEMSVPDRLPITYEFGRAGVVFARYQMLGTLPFPCAVAYHNYEQKDRERQALYDHDVIKLLYQAAQVIDPPTARYLLEQMPDKWNAYPQKLVDINSWYYLICQLVRVLAESQKETAKFLSSHPLLVYTKRFPDSDIPALNRRRQAKDWLRQQPVKYKIVMEQFQKLGYPELEEICEQAGGFADSSIPTDREESYLQILNSLNAEVYAPFFLGKKDIPCRVIRKENAAWAGKAEVVKVRDGAINPWGIKMKSQLKNIALMEKYFSKNEFPGALSTWLHEMAHMFGGDNTESFSLALTKLMEITILNSRSIDHYRDEWMLLK